MQRKSTHETLYTKFSSGTPTHIKRRTALQALGASRAKDALEVAERLPRVSVSPAQPRRVRPDASDDDNAPSGGKTGMADDNGATAADFSWELSVEVERLVHGGGGGRGGRARGAGRPRVYAPRFPKLKEEGWCVCL